MIKSHKSTINSVAWHPNSKLIATGCSDNKARVFCGAISEAGDEFDCGPFAEPSGDFDIAHPFGELFATFPANGWVEGVQWSPSGNSLAFVSHDSSISVAAISKSGNTVTSVKFNQLPFVCLDFLEENLIVAAGHDYNPAIFSGAGGKWSFAGYCDVKKKDAAGAGAKDGAGFRGKMTMFESKVSKGTDAAGADVFITKHQSLIMSIHNLGGRRFSTAALDGKVNNSPFLFWFQLTKITLLFLILRIGYILELEGCT
jgi:actin related protein 2/3 complex subunit 1A/1B